MPAPSSPVLPTDNVLIFRPSTGLHYRAPVSDLPIYTGVASGGGGGGGPDDDTALQTQITANNNALMASITTEQTVRATADTALASQITNLTAAVTTNNNTLNAAITNEQTVRSTADTALANQINTLTSTVATLGGGGGSVDVTARANITNEATTRAAADSAEAAIRQSADATLATAQGVTNANVTTLTNVTNTLNGKLSATWQVTTDVNGRISGIKLFDDGSTSTLNFTANAINMFDGVSDQPLFTLSGGQIRMPNVYIQNLTVGSVTTPNLVNNAVNRLTQSNTGSQPVIAGGTTADSFNFTKIGDATAPIRFDYQMDIGTAIAPAVQLIVSVYIDGALVATHNYYAVSPFDQVFSNYVIVAGLAAGVHVCSYTVQAVRSAVFAAGVTINAAYSNLQEFSK